MERLKSMSKATPQDLLNRPYIREAIREEDLGKVYTVAVNDPDINTPDLTAYLMSIGVDPLEYLDNIPPMYYHDGKNIQRLECGPRIGSIGTSAFNGAAIKFVDIGENCRTIRSYAFSRSQVETVVIHKACKDIHMRAFARCPHLEEIDYDGTSKEWYKIHKDSTWWEGSRSFKVFCRGDGRILHYPPEIV